MSRRRQRTDLHSDDEDHMSDYPSTLPLNNFGSAGSMNVPPRRSRGILRNRDDSSSSRPPSRDSSVARSTSSADSFANEIEECPLPPLPNTLQSEFGWESLQIPLSKGGGSGKRRIPRRASLSSVPSSASERSLNYRTLSQAAAKNPPAPPSNVRPMPKTTRRRKGRRASMSDVSSDDDDEAPCTNNKPVFHRSSSMRTIRTCLNDVSTPSVPAAPAPSNDGFLSRVRTKMRRRSSMGDSPATSGDESFSQLVPSKASFESSFSDIPLAPSAAKAVPRRGILRRNSLDNITDTASNDISTSFRVRSKATRRSSISDIPMGSDHSNNSTSYRVPLKATRRSSISDIPMGSDHSNDSTSYRIPLKATRRSSISDIPMGSDHSNDSTSYRVPSKAARRSSLSDIPLTSSSDGSAHYRVPSKAARRSSLSDVPETYSDDQSTSYRATRRSSLKANRRSSLRDVSQSAQNDFPASDDQSTSYRATRRSSLKATRRSSLRDVSRTAQNEFMASDDQSTSYRATRRSSLKATRRSSLSDVSQTAQNDSQASYRLASLSDAAPSRDMSTPLPLQKSILRRSSIGNDTPKSTASDGALPYRRRTMNTGNRRTSFSDITAPPMNASDGLMGYTMPLKSKDDSKAEKSPNGRPTRRRVLRSTRAASNYYGDQSKLNGSLSTFHFELENNYNSGNEQEESIDSNEDIYQSFYRPTQKDRTIYLSESDDSYDSDGGSTSRHLDEMESSARTGTSEINSVDGSWSIHNLAADQYQSDMDAASNPFPERSRRSGRRVSSIKIPVASLDCLSTSTDQSYNREESAKLSCMEGANWDFGNDDTFNDEDDPYDTPEQFDLDNDDDIASFPSRASMMATSRQMFGSEQSITIGGPSSGMIRQGSEHSITLTGMQRRGSGNSISLTGQRRRLSMTSQASEQSISIGDRRQMFKQQGSEHSISLFGSVGSDQGSMSDESDGAILDTDIFQDALMHHAASHEPHFPRRMSSGDYTLSLSNREEDYDINQSFRFGRRSSLNSIHGVDTSMRSRAISTISEDSFEISAAEMKNCNLSANLIYDTQQNYDDNDSESFYSSSEESYASDNSDSDAEGKRVKEGLLWGIGGMALGGVIGWVTKAFQKKSEAEDVDFDDIDTLGQSFAQSVLDDSMNFTGTDQLLAYASMGGDGGASAELVVAAFHASGTLETTIITAATSAAAPTTTTAAAATATAAATTAATQTMALTAAGNVGGIAVATATAVSHSAATAAGVGASIGGAVSVGGAAGSGVLAALGLTGGGSSTAAVMGSAIGAMAMAGSSYYSGSAWPSNQPGGSANLKFDGICPHPNPDNQTGTIQLSIDVSGMEGTEEEWGWMPFSDGKSNSNSSGEVLKELWEDLFVSQYNNITADGCNEMYERRIVDATLVSSDHTGTSEGQSILDTEWEVDVLCWEKCPTEPVFGTKLERRLEPTGGLDFVDEPLNDEPMGDLEFIDEPLNDEPIADLEMFDDDFDGFNETDDADDTNKFVELRSVISELDFRKFFESDVHAAATAAGWEKPDASRGKRGDNELSFKNPVQEELEEENPMRDNPSKGNPVQKKEKKKPHRIVSNSPYVARTEAPSITLLPSSKPTSSTQPSTSPSGSPTMPPSPLLSGSPSESPTAMHTSSPTEWPTESPTNSPSQSPSVPRTELPTDPPTETPSEPPTESPTETPSISLTEIPTESPTKLRSEIILEVVHLTAIPTEAPTESPTIMPVETSNPTTNSFPSLNPSETPTKGPSHIPSVSPSEPLIEDQTIPNSTPNGFDHPIVQNAGVKPSGSPSSNPSDSPSASSSESPSDNPSGSPSSNPSSIPTAAPSGSPSESPSGSYFPSNVPSDYPTTSAEPSAHPSEPPSISPSESPSTSPSSSPSESTDVGSSRTTTKNNSTLKSVPSSAWNLDAALSNNKKACCSLKLDDCISCPTTGPDEVVTEEICVDRCGFVPGTLVFLENGAPEKGSCLPRFTNGCNHMESDCCGPATCQQKPGISYHQCLTPGDIL